MAAPGRRVGEAAARPGPLGRDADLGERGAGPHRLVQGRVGAQAPVGARRHDLPGLAEAHALGQGPVEQGGRHAQRDEAEPLRRLPGAHGDVRPLGDHPADEGGGTLTHGIGGEILEHGRVRILRLQPRDEAGEAAAGERRIVEGLGEIRALGGGVGDAALLIDDDEVAVARIGDEAAGHLLHLAVAAAIHRAGRFESEARLGRRQIAQGGGDGGVIGLGGIERLDQVGGVRGDLRVPGDRQEVGQHPVGDEFDRVAPRLGGQLQALARGLDEARLGR